MFPSFLGLEREAAYSNQIQKGKYSKSVFASGQMHSITAPGPVVPRAPPALQPTHRAAAAAPDVQALPEALELAHCLWPASLQSGGHTSKAEKQTHKTGIRVE